MKCPALSDLHFYWADYHTLNGWTLRLRQLYANFETFVRQNRSPTSKNEGVISCRSCILYKKLTKVSSLIFINFFKPLLWGQKEGNFKKSQISFRIAFWCLHQQLEYFIA